MHIEPVGKLRGLTANDKSNAHSFAVEIVPNGASSSVSLKIGEHSHALITAWVVSGSSGRVASRATRVSNGSNGYLVAEDLGWPEGTAILSVESYKPAEHSVFSAHDDGALAFPSGHSQSDLLAGLIREAERFHGETCAGVVLGAKIMLHMMQTWQVGQKDPRLRLWLGSDGCIADTLIALSGATLGTGRLKVPGGRIYRFVLEGKGMAYYPTDEAFAPALEVLSKSVEALFAIREETERSEQRKPMHERRPPKHAKEEEALVQKVLDSLVDDKLSCAMAYKIADEMDVHIIDVGRAADEAKVKISHCQLGCFR